MQIARENQNIFLSAQQAVFVLITERMFNVPSNVPTDTTSIE
jgi:hypothetical protein